MPKGLDPTVCRHRNNRSGPNHGYDRLIGNAVSTHHTQTIAVEVTHPEVA